MSLILGIETSCDETGAAIVADGVEVRANIVASQHDLHRKYQGVVPEIASRAHLERILPVVQQALEEAAVSLRDIDGVAVGNRPGLIGSLLVGVSSAKALAWSGGLPLIGVDHVQAHLYAACLVQPKVQAAPDQAVEYPALGLVVSGGHTILFQVESPTQLHVLGKTLDDAVGEAYDKAAVILDAGYPGGPHLDQLAQQGRGQVKLPRPTLAADSLDFSFSGLKTALLYAARGTPQRRGNESVFPRSASDLTDEQRAGLAASFQVAAVETLIIKIDRAYAHQVCRNRRPHCLIVGGGVCANSLLRRRAVEWGQQQHVTVHLPAMEFCIDNAAMIAGLAHAQQQQGHCDDLHLPAMATAAVEVGH